MSSQSAPQTELAAVQRCRAAVRALTLTLLLAGTSSASSLDRDALKAVLQRASPGFKHCYETALKRETPGLSGRARLTLTVTAGGRVDEVTVEFPVTDPQFTQCLRDVAMKLHFGKGPTGYKLIWPIVFQGS